jgi:hypothetical protein
MKIEKWSPDEAKPYMNLLPIAEFLEEHGNAALDGGFIMTRDGWQCRMAKPLDVDLILMSFELPPNVQASEYYDSIHDRLTWSVIEGPNAIERSKVDGVDDPLQRDISA